jgi:glycerol-1-phosphate dehydrogenase [NAD(P)+]
VDELNRNLEQNWGALTTELRPLMLDNAMLEEALRRVGAPTSAESLGLPVAFWRDAIRYARFTRDRYSMLDLAADAGELDAFAAGCG